MILVEVRKPLKKLRISNFKMNYFSWKCNMLKEEKKQKPVEYNFSCHQLNQILIS